MRNSNSTPPRYGAEGPPGGPEAWAQQRAQQAQGGKDPNMMRRVAGMVAGMNPQALQRVQEQRQQMSAPRPWDQVGRAQWPPQGQHMNPAGPGPNYPQGMGGGPPQQPQGTPPMQSQPTQGQAQPTQGQAQPPMQTGMAGLGQAAGRVAQMARAGALRRRGMQQEQ